MYEIVFHPEAEEELNAAASYYEECKDGLGISYLHEIQKTILQIKEYPLLGTVVIAEIRRYRMGRFPYFLIYKIKDSLLIINKRLPINNISRCTHE